MGSTYSKVIWIEEEGDFFFVVGREGGREGGRESAQPKIALEVIALDSFRYTHVHTQTHARAHTGGKETKTHTMAAFNQIDPISRCCNRGRVGNAFAEPTVTQGFVNTTKASKKKSLGNRSAAQLQFLGSRIHRIDAHTPGRDVGHMMEMVCTLHMLPIMNLWQREILFTCECVLT